MEQIFENFESIVMEEAYAFPPNSIYRTYEWIEIHNDGTVEVFDYTKHTEKYYKASKENVEKLHETIIDFMKNIKTEIIYTDDTARTVRVNYRYVSIEAGACAEDENHKTLGELIKGFIRTKCKRVKEDE